MKKIIALFFIIITISCKSENKIEKRYVSLVPSITTILFELGLEDKIVGVTDYCSYSSLDELIDEQKIKKVSAFSSINFEKIASVNPTDIFCTDSTSIESYNKLKNLFGENNIHSLVHPRTIDEIFLQILEIGKITNKITQAEAVVKNLKSELIAIEQKTASIKNHPSVLVEIYYPPYTTAGRNTFISDIIRVSGGKLAISIEQDWPQITLEQVVKANPDIILKTHYADHNNLNDIIEAYKAKNVYTPDNINIFLQPGIHTIDAVEELSEYILSFE